MSYEEWEDLSTGELAQRLINRGVDPVEAYYLSRNRDYAINRREIEKALRA